MIPYTFKYHRPNSLEEAQSLFAGAVEPRFLAGGQTLIPAMKQRLTNPSDLIDLSAIGELAFVVKQGNCIVIGANTLHSEVANSEDIQDAIPALAELAGGIGDPAVRSMGTLGGSLANSDPASDYPAATLGLGATIITTKRRISADAFFFGLFQTALENGEIIRQVEFPVPARTGYAKFPNPASRYAIVGVFVAETPAGIRVAVTGAAPCVFRSTTMEQALTGWFDPDSLAKVSVDASGLNSDLHASAEYRAHLVTIMAKRAVAKAMVR